MFRRYLPPTAPEAAVQPPVDPNETATVRRIVTRLEALPPERARLVASAAYTLARAANADMDISDEETALMERMLQDNGALDEPTAIVVVEMAKLQARTVGGTEDYVVTRQFRQLATEQERLNVLRACFAIEAVNGEISSEESAVVNEIARELDIDPAAVSGVRADFHEQLSSVRAVRRAAEGR
ncbi:MAG: TerB family tellurite resistance protein [Chloroflexota bacterium]